MELRTTSVEKNIEDVIRYYNSCWLNRFSEGHNPKSYAMHFGIFKDDTIDNDAAKIQTNEFLIDSLNIPIDSQFNIADFGCGIGGTCMYVAQRYNYASVYGINISEEQINFARKVAEEKKTAGKLEYVLGDYSNTDLQSSSMNYVLAVESIWHAADKTKVFQEAYRVLDIDGAFSFIDYFQTRAVNSIEEEVLLREFNNGWGAYEEGTGPIKTFSQNYEADIKNIGFKNVESQSILDFVYKGILNSYDKALSKLENKLSEDLERHYKACVALKILVDKEVIDYRIVKANK